MRPYTQGERGAEADLQSLTRVLSRYLSDPKRDAKDKAKFQDIINEAITMVMKDRPSKKASKVA